MRISLSSLAACFLFFSLLVNAPASADWLVTLDGQRLETRGPWKVEGRRIVYTTPNGTLSAIRTDEVDLEASERASRPQPAGESAKRSTAHDERQQRAPALVLNTENVGRHRVAAPASSDSIEAAPPSDVVIASWREQNPPGEKLVIGGTVTNHTTSLAAAVRVEVTVYDERGQSTGTATAKLAKAALPPGASTTFQAKFPDLYITSDATFSIRYEPIALRDDATPPDASDADEDTENGAEGDSPDGGSSEGGESR